MCLLRVRDAPRHQQFGQHQRQMRSLRQRLRLFAVRGCNHPSLSRKRPGCASRCAHQRYTSSSAAFNCVVDHDIVEALRLQQRLVPLVPLRRRLVQKHNALVHKPKLHVSQHTHVLAQPLRFDQFRRFLVGEVHLPGLFNQRVQFLAFQRHFAEGDKRRAYMFRHLHEVFPRIGIALAVPQHRRDVFGYEPRQAAHAMALNEGHHVVFQRKKIVFAHVQRFIPRRCPPPPAPTCGNLLCHFATLSLCHFATLPLCHSATSPPVPALL